MRLMFLVGVVVVVSGHDDTTLFLYLLHDEHVARSVGSVSDKFWGSWGRNGEKMSLNASCSPSNSIPGEHEQQILALQK